MPVIKRSQRLRVVCDLIGREEESARLALAELQSSIQLAEQKVEELVDYQRQYQQELHGFGDASVRRLQNYHVFISRLGVAIEQQQRQLLQLRQRFMTQRDKWQKVYQKKTNMDSLVDRFRQQEQQVEEKKQQREVDDATGRQAHNHRLH